MIPINSVHCIAGPNTHLGSHLFCQNIWSAYNFNKQCTLHSPMKSNTHLGSDMCFVLSKVTAEVNYAICEQQTDSSTP